MTNGDLSGMNGIFWRRAFPLFAVTILALNTVNIFTEIQDNPGVHWIYPLIQQYTSALSAIACLPIALPAYRIAPLDSRPRWRVLAVHITALLIFSSVHVLGFYGLRLLVFAALDIPYQYVVPDRFIYELRKDGLGYFIGLTAFWALLRAYGRPQEGVTNTTASATFDIRDGAKVVRAQVADILAVSSAGNYVEFVLADGRKPLMRSSLTAIEAELAPHGFVRTHRSWLVNAARVTELRPEKSGDYAVGLGGVVAPLSRRFPEALARLRAGA